MPPTDHEVNDNADCREVPDEASRRIHPEVFARTRASVDQNVSDTTVFADFLAFVTGRQDLAEALQHPADIAPLCDPIALRALLAECERLPANTVKAQSQLPRRAGLSPAAEEVVRNCAKAS
jgi:hypothetical protein